MNCMLWYKGARRHEVAGKGCSKANGVDAISRKHGCEADSILLERSLLVVAALVCHDACRRSDKMPAMTVTTFSYQHLACRTPNDATWLQGRMDNCCSMTTAQLTLQP